LELTSIISICPPPFNLLQVVQWSAVSITNVCETSLWTSRSQAELHCYRPQFEIKLFWYGDSKTCVMLESPNVERCTKVVYSVHST
jgi:hypothetical protein